MRLGDFFKLIAWNFVLVLLVLLIAIGKSYEFIIREYRNDEIHNKILC